MKMIFDVCQGNHKSNILSEKALRAINSNYDKALDQEEQTVKQLDAQTEALRLMCRELELLGPENQARQVSTLAEVGKLRSNKSALTQLYLQHHEALLHVYEPEDTSPPASLPTPSTGSARKRNPLQARQSLNAHGLHHQRLEVSRRQVELQFVQESFKKLQAATGVAFSAAGQKKREELVQKLLRLRDAKEQLMELQVTRDALLQQRDHLAKKPTPFQAEPQPDQALEPKLHTRHRTADEDGLREAAKLARSRGSSH